jgi:exodeoxyribonuclease V alpha subunit
VSHVSEKGTVTGLVYESRVRQIFNLKISTSTIKVLIVDAQQRVAKGDHITVIGNMVVDVRFGKQLHAEKIKQTPVTHDLLVDFLMQGSGIGKAISERVVRAFPEKLVQILENKDVDILCSIERVSRASACIMVKQWHENAGKAALIPFIESILINAPATIRSQIKQSAKQSYAYYRSQTVEKLKEDPYRIWSFGSFKNADAFAKAMGVKPDDKRRLLCAVEEVIYKKFTEGHTQVYPLQFQGALEKIVGKNNVIKAIISANNSAHKSLPRIIVRHNKNSLNPVDSKFAQEGMELAAKQENSTVKNIYNQSYSLPGIAEIELYVQQQLQVRINEKMDDFNVTDEAIRSYQLQDGHFLNKYQCKAIKTVLSNAVTLISGGGGTGKTSVLYAVNDMIKKAGQHVLQVALSGKAAQRLVQQTDDDAFTISKLLNNIEKNGRYIDTLNEPVFHIDEASMVDLLTMFKVLKAFEGKCIRLVFIGDWAQLAPIGPGLIFHRLMTCETVPKVELKINYRSKGGIIDVSESVKAGEVFPANDEVELIEYDESQNVFDIISSKYLEATKDGTVHAIAATRKMVSEANIHLHKLMRKRDNYIAVAPEFRINDSVIYKSNNESLGLVNGSTGTIISGAIEGYKNEKSIINADLVIKFDVEGEIGLTVDQIKNTQTGDYILQHAYAITCHSAQGSEFDTAIIVIQNSKLVERSWLYTAITRAKKKTILIAKRGQIEAVLNRGFAFEKINSGLHL